VAFLAAATPVHAAPPWSEPVAVPSSRGPAALAFSPTGRGLLHTLGPGGYGRRYPGTSGATLEPDGSVGPFRVLARNLDAGGSPGRMAIDAAGRVSAVGEAGTGSGARLVAAGGSLGRTLSRRRDIGLGEPIASNATDSNTRGDHAVLFQVSGSSKSFRRRSIYLVVRRAGRAFGRPVRVARGPEVADLDVAVGEGGEVAVAWARERRVAVRRYSAGRLGRAQTVGDAGTGTAIRAAVASGGAVIVSWAAEELDAGPREEGENFGPYVVRAALAPPNGRFGPARQLSLSDRPSVAAEPVGAERFTLAYEGEESGRDLVRVAEAGPMGIASAQTVSDPGAGSALVDLATGPRGEAVVSWLVRGESSRFGEIVAAVRAPGAPSFSAAESVVRAPDIGINDLAIDPASGRVVVVFDTLGATAVRLVTRPPIAP